MASEREREPLVVAIMLVSGRREMTLRAIRGFQSQAYSNKRLLLWDNGTPSLAIPYEVFAGGRVGQHGQQQAERLSIGAMRNAAINCLMSCSEDWRPEIICHLDSDDLSHPQRITEQVALLQSSGADACGYYEAPFWDTRVEILKRKAQAFVRGEGPCIDLSAPPPGEAWLYRDPARKHVLGASLCYLRSAWERRPFDDINHGEDARFAARCKTVAVSAIEDLSGFSVSVPAIDVTRGGLFGGPADTHRRFIPGPREVTIGKGKPCEPRICCGVHDGNTSHGYDFSRRQQCFTRAPQFDKYCQERMAL